MLVAGQERYAEGGGSPQEKGREAVGLRAAASPPTTIWPIGSLSEHFSEEWVVLVLVVVVDANVSALFVRFGYNVSSWN